MPEDGDTDSTNILWKEFCPKSHTSVIEKKLTRKQRLNNIFLTNTF